MFIAGKMNETSGKVRPIMTETTALGAAMMAGMADGINVWDLQNTPKVVCDTFSPTITDDERDLKYSRWKMAIERSLNWEPEPKSDNKKRNKFSSVAPALFIMFSLGVLLCAKQFK